MGAKQRPETSLYYSIGHRRKQEGKQECTRSMVPMSRRKKRMNPAKKSTRKQMSLDNDKLARLIERKEKKKRDLLYSEWMRYPVYPTDYQSRPSSHPRDIVHERLASNADADPPFCLQEGYP